jgi:3-oxoadipate enol-lactonase
LGELGNVPTLAVSGDEDRIAPPALGRALAAAIPGARYHELQRAAHALTIQRAAEVNALLVEHFDRS